MTKRTRSTRSRRLLTAGLVAGVGTVAFAGAAQAEPTTVDAGHRAPVTVSEVSPAALPAASGSGSTRRTNWVTVTL
jgi:hypothetical protein